MRYAASGQPSRPAKNRKLEGFLQRKHAAHPEWPTTFD
jgi:hypothetical protein